MDFEIGIRQRPKLNRTDVSGHLPEHTRPNPTISHSSPSQERGSAQQQLRLRLWPSSRRSGGQPSIKQGFCMPAPSSAVTSRGRPPSRLRPARTPRADNVSATTSAQVLVFLYHVKHSSRVCSFCFGLQFFLALFLTSTRSIKWSATTVRSCAQVELEGCDTTLPTSIEQILLTPKCLLVPKHQRRLKKRLRKSGKTKEKKWS